MIGHRYGSGKPYGYVRIWRLGHAGILGSALGGIAFAITWAKSRSRNPATREQIINSLKQRLEKGELSQQDFARRMAEIDTKKAGICIETAI